ncbi:soluble lamin-associated protein of 75 kDa-like isoform X1 [Cataglyphis hispanica]|uniref:soluble lamin-associated protein of 75 kDa-like isoform X1 n=1 Tax=Cataglyphis hispanica TaxID=1086592 RepID=UPI0021804B12|nr:soluble lamin-associated protein of 75 kDa-like isoform X1 [Cataglyphis hispanica]
MCGLIWCARCVRTETIKLDLSNVNIQGDVHRVDCIDGDHFVNIVLNDEIIDINNIYSDRLVDEWRQVQSDRDKVLHYILSQIVYPNFDAPRAEKFESLYAPVDEHDIVSLRWYKGKAIGFYTVKPTGTEIFSTKERYVMPIVDTAYIRSEYRNRGFGTEILSDVIARFPNEDIGFSKPISNGMLRILKTFLMNHKEYRLRFWEIADCDIGVSQQLIWCRLKKWQ